MQRFYQHFSPPTSCQSTDVIKFLYLKVCQMRVQQQQQQQRRRRQQQQQQQQRRCKSSKTTKMMLQKTDGGGFFFFLISLASFHRQLTFI